MRSGVTCSRITTARRTHLTSVSMQGLDVGNCDIMLHVRVCEGLVRQLDGSIEKRFACKELLYPIQVHCSTKPAHGGQYYMHLPDCHACTWERQLQRAHVLDIAGPPWSHLSRVCLEPVSLPGSGDPEEEHAAGPASGPRGGQEEAG